MRLFKPTEETRIRPAQILYDPDTFGLLFLTNGELLAWNLADSRPRPVPVPRGHAGVRRVVLSPERALLLVERWGWDGDENLIWDLGTWEPRWDVPPGFAHAAFRDDRTLLAFRVPQEGRRNVRQLWQVTLGGSPELLMSCVEQRAAYLSPFWVAGNTVVGNSEAGRLFQVDLERREKVAEYGLASGEVRAALSPDGGFLAGATNRLINLYDTTTYKKVRTLRGHTNHVTALRFHPDGGTFLSGSRDSSVRLWDTTGNQRAAWNFGLGPISCLDVAPDGMTAAVAGEKGEIVVWDLDL